MTSQARAWAVLAVGLGLSVLQPTACSGRDLRFDAARSLVDARHSYLGDPGPSLEAARRLERDPRAPLYDRNLEIGSAFIYPPIAARPYAPLAWLPAAEAREALSTVNRLLLLGIVAMLAALARPRWLALLALAFFPLLHAVQLNQATLAVTALLGGAFLLLVRRGDGALAGVCLGAACAIKPQLALVLPLLAWHARRAAASAVLTGALLLALSVQYAGVANHVAYATKVLPTLSRGYAYFANQSVNGLLQRFVFSGDLGIFRMPPRSLVVSALTTVLGVAAYVATLAFVARTPRQRELAPWVFALAWLVCTAISPIAWQHHYCAALFVFAMLASAIDDGRLPDRLWPQVALSFVLMAAWFEVRSLRGPVATLAVSHVLFGAALLALVLTRAIPALRRADQP